jgi:hypothetical protein
MTRESRFSILGPPEYATNPRKMQSWKGCSRDLSKLMDQPHPRTTNPKLQPHPSHQQTGGYLWICTGEVQYSSETHRRKRCRPTRDRVILCRSSRRIGTTSASATRPASPDATAVTCHEPSGATLAVRLASRATFAAGCSSSGRNSRVPSQGTSSLPRRASRGGHQPKVRGSPGASASRPGRTTKGSRRR